MPNTAKKIDDHTLPFQLQGSSFNILVLKIQDPDDPSLFPQLNIKVKQAPNFFHQAPVVIDLKDVKKDLGVAELSSFAARMKQCHLVPVGVQGASPATQKAALVVGLAVMSTGRPAKETVTAKAPPIAQPAIPEPAREKTPPKVEKPTSAELPASGGQASLIITEPVRSGQQIYAAKGDLVIMAPVSAGAELLADGNIHIYSSLRGRALAGLGGDPNARIFCHSLEAELVSVAGLYRISEDIGKEYWKKSVQIYQEDGYLRIRLLGT